MYGDLREKLSLLLMQYSYKTIDEGLKELIREYKYHFDQDYALITPEDTSKNIVVSVSPQTTAKPIVTVDAVKVEADVEPKKIVVKKPKAKSGSKASAGSKATAGSKASA
jgi:hypothetical protein